MTKRLKPLFLLATALTGGALCVMPGQAMAQSATPSASSEARSYAIPAQGLSDALRQFAEASGLQLVYDSKITAGKASAAVSGRMTAQDALGQMLAGSGLTFAFSNNGSVIITAGAADGVRSLGVVRVEGAGGSGMASGVNGINGSRDVEATEGTGSYTTGAVSIGTKEPQSIKDTPASISVLTAKNISDQNITNLKDALNQLSGVTLVQTTVGNGDSTRGAGFDQAQFYSRGFEITGIQIDGGGPISNGGSLTAGNNFNTGTNFYTPVIDLSIYEDGGSLNLPVTTCLCFPWNHSDFRTSNYFVNLDQKIGKNWSLTVKATRTIQNVNSKYGFASGTIDRITQAGSRITLSQAMPRTRQWAVDGTLKGAFMLFGQRQEVLVGGNYQYSNSGGAV